jgi:hypothetical protein
MGIIGWVNAHGQRLPSRLARKRRQDGDEIENLRENVHVRGPRAVFSISYLERQAASRPGGIERFNELDWRKGGPSQWQGSHPTSG